METFSNLARRNPCDGCPAVCCRVQIHPCVPPQDIMGLDHIRFSLLFPNTELLIMKNGTFSLVQWNTCSLFEEGSCSCSIHNTPDKPLTCAHFNPHNCWYKKNLTVENPTDLCRINKARFEKWVKNMKFDNTDKIIEAPDFAETQELIKGIPIEPNFELDPSLVKPTEKAVNCDKHELIEK